jgi:diguanylate cyclase (GGDEF)-like protein/PAS domain S-box-containing protein
VERLRDDLERSEGQYRSLVDSTDDSIYVVDRDCRYLFINRKHLTRLGLSGNNYHKRHYRESHSDEETAVFQEEIASVFLSGKSIQHEYRAKRDNKYFLRTLSPVRDAGGAVSSVSVISKEITERKLLEEELHALSLTDELTGLYNRRGFFTLVQQELRVAGRLKKSVQLFAVDMDDLKVINDTFGHQMGDLAIREAADIIKRNFRQSDVIARIGGDEFAVFMIEHIDIDQEKLVRRLQDILSIYNSQGRRPYTLSLSIGAARYGPGQPATIEEMMTRADALMYDQKRGRSRASS